MLADRPPAPFEQLGGPPPPLSERALDQPVDEPDLASWAWHRATGAAVAVLAATVLGAAVGGPGGALVAGVVAGAVTYGTGPVIAVLERLALRHPPVTPRRLRRTWVLAVLVLLVATAVLGVRVDGLLFLPVYGGPIAVAAAWLGVVFGLALPPRVGRPLAVGVPTGLAVAAGHAAGLDLIDAAVVLAVVVVVPTAVPLLPEVPGSAGLLALLAGAPVAVAVALDPGPTAVALTLPWAVATCSATAVLGWRWWVGPPRAADLVWPLAAGYLAFGSLWLLADRAAFEPAGFGPPFVQLTAVHFTYAGSVTTVLAARAWRRRPQDRVAVTSIVATAAAPPVIAAGFAALGALQVVGALAATVGTWTLAWVTLRRVVPTAPRPAAWCLGASSLSVLVPMLLAVQWAVGANLGTPALSVPQMAATHGSANALGFCLLGVLGWRLLDRDATEEAG